MFNKLISSALLFLVLAQGALAIPQGGPIQLTWPVRRPLLRHKHPWPERLPGERVIVPRSYLRVHATWRQSSRN
ncbi:hypothetical protein B0H14DRAFT_3868200 [Mycena olivaceomarginata]|nr:hypothetical protein B0H14DRAFT_3868200 [Mycena olivaceomarginata]